MTAYALIMGILFIIIMFFLWIPMFDVFGGTGGVIATMNSLAGGDADIIAWNNMIANIFFYTPFALIIIVGIYILKSVTEKPDPYGGYYA